MSDLALLKPDMAPSPLGLDASGRLQVGQRVTAVVAGDAVGPTADGVVESLDPVGTFFETDLNLERTASGCPFRLASEGEEAGLAESHHRRALAARVSSACGRDDVDSRPAVPEVEIMADTHARRVFLRSTVLLPCALAAARPLVGGAAPGRQAHIKLSCNLYSFNAPLRSGEMALEQVIDFCAELGFDAVDPTGYYFPGYPEPPADAYVNAVKRRAFLGGLDVSGTGVRNDFTQPEAAKRDADVAHVKRWVEVAAKLGAPVLRVFDGRAEAAGPTREQRIGWVADCFRECAAHGERHGVLIAYQNHDELLKTADEVLALRERVASDWFGLNVDVGSLRTGDPYEEIARLAPFACTWQIKERLYRKGQEEKTDVKRVFAILREAGYRGYAPIETLGEGDPREKVRRFLDEVRTALA